MPSGARISYGPNFLPALIANCNEAIQEPISVRIRTRRESVLRRILQFGHAAGGLVIQLQSKGMVSVQVDRWAGGKVHWPENVERGHGEPVGQRGQFTIDVYGVCIIRNESIRVGRDKADRNLRDHGVGFEEATTAFNDQNRVEGFDEGHSEDEARHSVIGFSSKGRLLFVAFTIRRQAIRIIHARLAEKKWRRVYEKESRGRG